MTPNEPRRHAGLGLAQVCLAGILWGTGGLGVQVIREADSMPVVTISAWRMAIAAAVLLLAVAALRRGRDLARLLRARPGRVVLVGSGTAAYQALYFGAVVAVGVSVSTVVSLGLAPVLLTAAESVLGRRLPSRAQLVVLGLALAGLALVSLAAGAHESGPHPGLGLALAAASGATYAATTAFGRTLAQQTGPLALTTATTSVGAVVLLPGALVAGGLVGPLADPMVAGTLVYLGVFTMALAYGLLYAGLRTIAGSAAVVATLLEPVAAAVLAALLLDERIGLVGVVGMALILAAVAGLARRAPARAPVADLVEVVEPPH